MPKLKIHKGVAKRFKGKGLNLKRKQARKNHNLLHRTTKNKRQLRGTAPLAAGDRKAVQRLLRRI